MWVESCSGLLSAVGGGESAISTIHDPSEPDQPLKPTPETCSHQGVPTVSHRENPIVARLPVHRMLGVLARSFMSAPAACRSMPCRRMPRARGHVCAHTRGCTHQGCRVARMLRLTRPTNVQSCCLVGNSPRRRSAHSLREQTNKQAPFLLPVLPVPNVPGGAVLTMFTCAIRDADCTTLTIAH